jgi:hypothetical protein
VHRRNARHHDRMPVLFQTALAARAQKNGVRNFGESVQGTNELPRGFDQDVLTCPCCGRRKRLLALVTDPKSIARYLRGIGEPPTCRIGRLLEDLRTGPVVCSGEAPVASRRPSRVRKGREDRGAPACRLVGFGTLRARAESASSGPLGTGRCRTPRRRAPPTPAKSASIRLRSFRPSRG